MRVFRIHSGEVTETDRLPEGRPAHGFVWIACSRQELESQQAAVQATLQALGGSTLLDLHVSDLLNRQLPSHFDNTSRYDLLVFRRLAASHGEAEAAAAPAPAPVPRRSGPPVLRRIDTSPVGFAVFDRVLLTVHPADCSVRDTYAARLLAAHEAGDPAAEAAPADPRSLGARGIPTSPADLMLRLLSQIVDGYLSLRRELTRQLDHWQAELLHPATRFSNWGALLDARLALHQIDEICEDQRAAVQAWIEALAGWPEAETAPGQHELLRVRSRDVLEHIERVVHHVRRLEHSAETAIQIHFSAQGHRTNDIMRTLTALTAIFLPLNLIAGIFGMNFEFIPLLHRQSGFWWAMGSMTLIALALGLLFWRKRYLARTGH